METKLKREWLKTASSCISDDNQRPHPEVTAALQQFKFVAARLTQTQSDTKLFPTAWVKRAAQRLHGLPQDQQKQQFTSATLFAMVQQTSCICTGPAVSTGIPSVQAYQGSFLFVACWHHGDAIVWASP